MNALRRSIAAAVLAASLVVTPLLFAHDEWVHDCFNAYEHIADHDEVSYLDYQLAHIHEEACNRLLSPRTNKAMAKVEARICSLERNYPKILLTRNLEKTCHSIREDLYRLEDKVQRSPTAWMK